jgi:hypothetical protein
MRIATRPMAAPQFTGRASAPYARDRFPHIPGDIGHVATWPFPVIYKVVRGTTGERVTALGRKTEADLLGNRKFESTSLQR